MTIKLIVGLGNPGQKYEHTRHNAGFWFVDELARQANQSWQSKAKFQGEYVKIEINGRDIHVIKPSTFMNLSGQSVASVANYFNISVDEVLVVHDELDVLPGAVKIKKGGGHGGHNGLKDIERHLSSRDFVRVRIGIGHPGDARLVSDYVLKAPSKIDAALIEDAQIRVFQYLDELLSGDINKVMNALH